MSRRERRTSEPTSDHTEQVRERNMMDALLDRMILESTRWLNAGKNGIILDIDTERAQPILRAWLAKKESSQKASRKGVDAEPVMSDELLGGLLDQRVIKVLKVYRPDDAKREYEIQRAAFDALEKANDPRAAHIPRPYLYYELELSPQTRTYLNSLGTHIEGTKAGLIFMDRLQGTDLGTLLLREVIRRHPEGSVFLRNDASITAASFDRLYPIITELLKDERGPSNVFEDPQILRAITFLRRKGFILHPAIVDCVERALNVLHRQGICHRDCHQRNIFVEGPLERPPTKTTDPSPLVHLIDFGESVQFQGDYLAAQDDLYRSQSSTTLFTPDEFVLGVLRPLTRSEEEREERETNRVVLNLLTIVSGLRKPLGTFIGNLDRQVFVTADQMNGLFFPIMMQADADTKKLACAVYLFEHGKTNVLELRKYLLELQARTLPVHRNLIQSVLTWAQTKNSRAPSEEGTARTET